ncbi:hypothetical protein P879_09840 [Paragonimus westermani]|uniref:Calcineurin-like phosphoesterase domain-containing protein n=1 Tax=Paragonimus westermani TaxID=34504 RepID=A0A8T0CZA3_9TREM|nr:hypothetical protein P879_09840 [Paragonimus westermani]
MPTPEKIQSLLKSAIYLEDAWCRVLGLTIYGTSWTAADDLRSEDGVFVRRYWNRLFQTRRHKHSSEVCSAGYVPHSALVTVPNHSSHSFPEQGSLPVVDPRNNGFVLPDIADVALQWERIPDNTDVVVTHMPAWRQELFVHIVERIKPTLHLCGHDFAGYGVMWKRDTLFSNAALQLNSTFPSIVGFRKPQVRKQNKKTTVTSTTTTKTTLATSSDAADESALNIQDQLQSYSAQIPMSYDPDFCEPQLYIPKPNGRPRPPRWQRRLPRALSRLFFGSGSSNNSGSGCTGNCSLFRRSLRPKPTVVVSETKSSKAAAEHICSDVGFIYDPDMRAGIGAMAVADSVCGSGSGAGYSGGSTGFTGSTLCTSMCRRNPIVIDVYVVSDDMSTMLPPYASSSPLSVSLNADSYQRPSATAPTASSSSSSHSAPASTQSRTERLPD